MTPSDSPANLVGLSDPIPASTLILVREAAGGLQVCLLRRSLASGFMPGSFVFPGGWVDAEDRDEAFWQTRMDLPFGSFAQRLGGGLSAGLALSQAVAAVRETFEEAGVLFAAPGSAGGAPGNPRPVADRFPAGGFRGWVEAQNRLLTLSALSPWSRWVTPVGMPRRFDTFFFVAELPAGQGCRADGRETTAVLWSRPQEAIAQNLAGRVPLGPPTLVSLQELSRYPDLASLRPALQNRAWGAPLLPRRVDLGKGEGCVILEPWDPQYTDADLRLEAGRLAGRLLAAGEPFSRLWNRDGIWRPIAIP
jgi:8-oxo-dGTP pyrophosphatase MutT (NUDIX family)